MKINGNEIKGVIFDMDGVILDSMPLWTQLGKRYVEKYGKGADEEFTKAIFSMSIEEGIAYFKERYGITQSNEEILHELESYIRAYYYNEVKAKNGAKELMESLKEAGIKVTAATSSMRHHIEHALERNGLLGYIDKLFTSSEVGSSKSDPEIYHLAAEHMGTAPSETLVFEDSLYALKTAKATGYHTVGVYDAIGEPDQEGLKAEADIYISSPGEFLKRLNNESIYSYDILT